MSGESTINSKRHLPHRFIPPVPKMTKGDTYLVEMLKNVKVVQGTKSPSQEFDLEKGRILIGVFDITTALERWSFFHFDELDDVVALPPGSFKVESGD